MGIGFERLHCFCVCDIVKVHAVDIADLIAGLMSVDIWQSGGKGGKREKGEKGEKKIR